MSNEEQNKPLQQPLAEYYKWIDLQKRGQSAMTMKQIFDYWQSRSN
jgi:hypothetical protein